MDVMNGLPGDPFPLTGMPFGFSMALADDEDAMNGFAGLTETEKEHLILRCKDARSKEEVQSIVDSLAPNTGMGILAEESALVNGSLNESSGMF